MKQSVVIDGSFGEGGGQILRTSLALSALTGIPFRIFNIRANRKKAGLRPQHLQCVRAMAEIASARVEGAEIDSRELFFEPSEIRTGEFRFDIGTAGSVALVLQSVFPALATQRSESFLRITGGTHVPFAPCFHYLEHQWLPHLERIGFNATLAMKRAGYYPEGGGMITARIEPPSDLKPLALAERGELKRIYGFSAVSNLPLSIAERQQRRALKRLRGLDVEKKIEITPLPSKGMGTVLLLVAEFERSRVCYFGLGAKGKPAEKVADEAYQQLHDFLHTDAAIDRYLADQLLLPLSLVEAKSFISTERVTQHLITNAEVIKKFLPVEINIQGELDEQGFVHISGVNPKEI